MGKPRGRRIWLLSGDHHSYTIHTRASLMSPPILMYRARDAFLPRTVHFLREPKVSKKRCALGELRRLHKPSAYTDPAEWCKSGSPRSNGPNLVLQPMISWIYLFLVGSSGGNSCRSSIRRSRRNLVLADLISHYLVICS